MKVEKEEGRQDLVVLDAGREGELMVGPLIGCCGAALVILWW